MRLPMSKTFAVNKEILLGAHLVSPRGLYTHHGIYIGNGQVIHYSGLADGLQAGPICQVSLEEFSDNQGFSIRHYHHYPYSPEEIVERAYQRLGEDNYHVINNNCEHFATWCVTNSHECRQWQDISSNILAKTFGKNMPHLDISSKLFAVDAKVGVTSTLLSYIYHLAKAKK